MSDEITGIIESAAADLSASEAPAPDPAPSEASGSAVPEGGAASDRGAAPAESAPAAPPPTAAPPVMTPEQTEEAELGALEQELLAKDGRLRGRMGVARHQAILSRVRKQHEQILAQAADQLERAKQYETPEFTERMRAFQIAESNPDAFLQILQAIPQYKARIDALITQAIVARGGTAAIPPPAAPAEDKEPEPDTLLDGGGMGYSVERANQLWQWRLNQAKQAYDAELDKIRGEMAPIHQERAARERIEQAFTRQGGVLSDARANWPLFAQYESKIREELMKPGNERMQLDQAYRVVVIAGERAARPKIEAEERARIQKELNGQAASPRSLRPGLPPAELTKVEGDQEIDTIIRNAARSLS